MCRQIPLFFSILSHTFFVTLLQMRQTSFILGKSVHQIFLSLNLHVIQSHISAQHYSAQTVLKKIRQKFFIMHYFCYFVRIRLEISDRALGFGLLDEIRNTKLLQYTTFRTRHIYVACTGSYKSTPSLALILASNITILSLSISLDNFIL